jgi:accessory colonization factor AcfC
MANAELRPHLRRPCPLKDSHYCDWVQVTSWFVGGPATVVEVPQDQLQRDAERHMEAHYGPRRTWFT